QSTSIPSFYFYLPLLPLHSFPTRRSSDLTRKQTLPSSPTPFRIRFPPSISLRSPPPRSANSLLRPSLWIRIPSPSPSIPTAVRIDRKSTRLNSSHGSISYAVFCLKKKK